MAIQYGGKSKKLTATQKKQNAKTTKTLAAKSSGKSATVTATATATKSKASKSGAPKITAQQFAENQLRKAGITPRSGKAAQAQFRALNAKAKAKRVAAGLGKASTVHASSALAAGNRTANPVVLKKRAAVKKTAVRTRGARTYQPGKGK